VDGPPRKEQREKWVDMCVSRVGVYVGKKDVRDFEVFSRGF